MSGICGILQRGGGRAQEAVAETMMAAAPWRGPNGCRSCGAGPAAMGFLCHRLMPESAGESQPLVHGPTGVILAADLRLDNRGELAAAQERSSTAGLSDAQLLLDCYLRWGRECAGRLLGDFAYALWDPRSRTLELARDAMGMRALYYHLAAGQVVWATEVKQILAVRGVPRRLNEAAVAAHLSGSHLPPGMSFYEGIAQVQPGEVVRISAGAVERQRFWQLEPKRKLRYRREREYTEHFRELFEGAVECRLRSAKPVGISLSGGLDSGSIASMVGWLFEQGRSRFRPAFRAYSWAFEELPECDERKVSAVIAERYGIPLIAVPADEAWPLKDYPEHGPDEDEPFFGIYQVLIEHLISRAVSDGVGVVISGDRGDLMAGGNVPDLPGLLGAWKLRALAREMHTLGMISGLSLPRTAWCYLARPLISRAAWSLGRRPRMKRGLAGLSPPPHVRSDFLKTAVNPDFIPFSRDCRAPDRAVRDRYRYVFAEMHMQGMVWSERTNARCGAGFAEPWSDRRIAEFVLSVPQHVIHRLAEPKNIIRKAMEGIMPPAALEAARKVSPQPLFLRALRGRARGTLESLSTRMLSAEGGYIDEGKFRSWMQRLLDGEIDYFDLWSTLSLEMWLRKYWN